MTLSPRHLVIPCALAVCLFAGCCHKKKPPVPAAANAPTITPETTPTPAPSTTTTTTTTTPTQPQPTTPSTPAKPSANKTKPKQQHTSEKKPVQPPQTSPGNVSKNHNVVTEGGTNEANTGQISTPATGGTGTGPTTAQLLATTDNNLKNLHRQLTPDEQAMVQQIQDYEKQSREATTQGDGVRAYNLAMKARLLSDELVNK